MVCRVSDDEIRSHSHSHTDTDGDCGLGGYGVWGDGSEGAIHNLGKARQQAGKSSVSASMSVSVSVSVMDVQAIMPARQRFPRPGRGAEEGDDGTGRLWTGLDWKLEGEIGGVMHSMVCFWWAAAECHPCTG